MVLREQDQAGMLALNSFLVGGSRLHQSYCNHRTLATGEFDNSDKLS
jgi:hypothetical protein